MSANPDFSLLIHRAKEFEKYPAGSAICRAGDPGHCMYVIKEGEVEIRVGDTVVERIPTGGIFGEMALIDASPRSADAIAVSDCELVPVNTRQFQFLVQETPFFALNVMQVMSRRLRKMDISPVEIL